MNEEYVTYEQAKALSEAGFDYFGADKLYIDKASNKRYDRSTLAQAAKWLREKKNLHIMIGCQNKDEWGYFISEIGATSAMAYGINNESYEAALSAGVSKCLEIINDKTE